MTLDKLQIFALYVIPLILSLSLHEFAHAWAAKKLGDDTAEKLGRLTLNPLSHIDPIGTILLPLMFTIYRGAPLFAWAKPVPFEPSRFRRDITARKGSMLVALAGPVSNLLLLVVSAVIVAVASHWFSLPEAVYALLTKMMLLNAGLFIFNLIPVYPLDGHKVLSGLLPLEMAQRYDDINYRFGSFIMWPLLLLGGRFLAVPVLFLFRGVQMLTGVL